MTAIRQLKLIQCGSNKQRLKFYLGHFSWQLKLPTSGLIFLNKMIKILIMVKILRTREVPQSLPRSCLYCIAHPETRKGKQLFVKQIVFLNKSVSHTFGLNNILFIENT